MTENTLLRAPAAWPVRQVSVCFGFKREQEEERRKNILFKVVSFQRHIQIRQIGLLQWTQLMVVLAQSTAEYAVVCI